MFQPTICAVPKKPFSNLERTRNQEAQVTNSSTRLNPPRHCVSAKKVVVPHCRAVHAVDLTPVATSSKKEAKPDHLVTFKPAQKVTKTVENEPVVSWPNPPRHCVSAKKVVVSHSSTTAGHAVDLTPVATSTKKEAKPDHLVTFKPLQKVTKTVENDPVAGDHYMFNVLQQRMKKLEDRDMALRDKIRKQEQLLAFCITKLFNYWKMDDLPMPYEELPCFVQLELRDKFNVEKLAVVEETFGYTKK